MTKNLIILALIICSTKLWAANSDYTPYVIKKGEIIAKGNYKELINISDEFKRMNVIL